MATIEIRARSNADSYWIKVDKQDVHMSGPRGDATGIVMVPAGPHTMFWGMFGDPGEVIEIRVLEDGSDLISEPVTGEVPEGYRVDGGFADFVAE